MCFDLRYAGIAAIGHIVHFLMLSHFASVSSSVFRLSRSAHSLPKTFKHWRSR